MELPPADKISVVPPKCNPDRADAAFRTALTAAIRKANKSRAEIAEELSAVVGRNVSVAMLAECTEPGKWRVRFPAAWIEPLCAILGNDSLRRQLLSPHMRDLLALGESAVVALRSDPARRRLVRKLTEEK